ncbi:hypothetical protein MNEG_15870 [Monoraphidium neglectum]|jgi:hypothetical protein|uniref:Uncharacterized protein n=1 Tax=Monoraphidium neglectum TaxID=145388 RepID=A0A0D2K7D9_9CHLO|nr:hypothetical protein MNEG_15870 [Monoraphidium neglectum]KIY92093.1 hypothetical protein MNEG_15870 [Monoraphidium neglectum]|eukprot:XP_013891113.1 hypothetical protein MNEG_15870 [Monoraphidium neglectum]
MAASGSPDYAAAERAQQQQQPAAACSEEQALLLLSRLQLPVGGQPNNLPAGGVRHVPAVAAAATAGAAPAAGNPAGDVRQPPLPMAASGGLVPSELRVEYEKRVEAVREALAELRRFELMHVDGGAGDLVAATAPGGGDGGGM